VADLTLLPWLNTGSPSVLSGEGSPAPMDDQMLGKDNYAYAPFLMLCMYLALKTL